jgi:hypothetical protein
MFLPFWIWTRGKNQGIIQVCEYQRTLFLNKIVYFFMYSKNEKDYLYMKTLVLSAPNELLKTASVV